MEFCLALTYRYDDILWSWPWDFKIYELILARIYSVWSHPTHIIIMSSFKHACTMSTHLGDGFTGLHSVWSHHTHIIIMSSFKHTCTMSPYLGDGFTGLHSVWSHPTHIIIMSSFKHACTMSPYLGDGFTGLHSVTVKTGATIWDDIQFEFNYTKGECFQYLPPGVLLVTGNGMTKSNWYKCEWFASECFFIGAAK